MDKIETQWELLAWTKWQKLFHFIIFLESMDLITAKMYDEMVNDLMTFKNFAEDCENYSRKRDEL